MKTQKQIIGDLGEGVTCNYLKKNGFEIIERNYWKKWGEIDIIAEKFKKLHFVEVKTTSMWNKCGFYREQTQNHIKNNVTRGTNVNEINNVNHETILLDGWVNDNLRVEDNLHPWKLKRLSRVIQSYLLEKYKENDVEWQFDVVIIYLDIKNKQAKVKYIEDIIL